MPQFFFLTATNQDLKGEGYSTLTELLFTAITENKINNYTPFRDYLEIVSDILFNISS